MFVDFGSRGKCLDSVIFKTSSRSERIHENTLNIPPGKPLNGTFGPSFPSVFVGDEEFGLLKNRLRPYAGNISSKAIY